MKGRILLKGLEFHGFHGCHPGESMAGQRFVVDLALTADLSAASAADSLASAVDYERVHELCRRIVEKGRTRLLETLCRKIGEAVLRKWPQVESVQVTVKKPVAPIPGIFEYVAIEAEIGRRGGVPRPRK
jgi:dihydroneopterin aldolase